MILHVLNPGVSEEVIRQRRRLGQDRKDEVWNGEYMLMPDPTIEHQRLVKLLMALLAEVVESEGRGEAFPGTNVSDRREGWKYNFRAPDIVVVLNDGRAINCDTHWYGGPDFLVEIQSPRDKSEEKIPFYAELGVRELLLIHRDSRRLRLLRHDGTGLIPVDADAKKWLTSEVVPLAFRRAASGKKPRTDVRRTDSTAGRWVV